MERFAARRLLAGGASVGLALAIILVTPSVGVTQSIPGSALKAALMLNFVKFTEWPARPPDLPFRFCVMDNDVVADALTRTVAGQAVSGRALQVTRLDRGGDLSSCQLLFVAERDTRRLAALLEEARRFPMLTVSDIEQSASNGVMIEFFIENGRQRFAINVETLERSGLKISSRVLTLAKIIKK
jgi:hypothetical protein